ncbi:hypothetical protein F4774DRAFT_144329 [Daldinia eschscholtzii]|nr:hypothetical protein F4774DRAFT_144329 [Daldinia eschscholtzii]
MAGPIPPYALFVLADGIDADYLSDALTRAYKGNYEAAWEQYVVTGSYDDAPKKLENAYPEGTKPPVDANFQSPFIGKTPEECVLWLQNAPEDVALNHESFFFIDQFSKEDDTMQICRAENDPKTGKLEVEYYPVSTEDATLEMATALGVKFDENMQRYQRNRIRDGKPDRSKGVPYSRI